MSTADNKAVFLSYASQDAAAVSRIAEALRAAGVEVWFDQNELVGGDAWDQKIRKQIKECALFVPVISAATQARLEGYFRREWNLAAARMLDMARGKPFLLPIVIDDTRDQDAQVPEEFVSVQWTRLPGGETNSAFCERVKTLLAPPGDASRTRPAFPLSAAEKNPAGTRSPTPPPPQRRLAPRLALRALAVIALGGVLFFALRPSPSTDESARPTVTSATKAASAPVTGPRAESQQLVAKAWEHLNRPGLSRVDLEIADDLCKQAAALDTNNSDVWATWAQVDAWYVFYSLEDTPERREAARTKSARAVRLDPKSFEARLAEACSLVRAAPRSGLGVANEFYPAAEQTLRTLLHERENDPRVYLALGILLRNSGRFAEGAAMLDRMAALPGSRAIALNEKGWLLRFAGDFRGALEADDQSIAAQPFDGNLFLRVGLSLTWTGDLDVAKATVVQIPSLILTENFGLTSAVFLFAWRHEPEAMLRLLNAAPRAWLASNNFVGPRHFLIGVAQHLAGNEEAAQLAFREALRVVEQRLEKEPDSADALWVKARVLRALDRRADADATARLASSLGTAENLDALIELGYFDRAFAYLEHPRASQKALLNWANLKLNPALDPLRNDPRFQALLAAAEADPLRNPNAKTKPAAAASSMTSDGKSVAVLAFADNSPAHDSEYFSDGISEELINALGKVPGLKVPARTSSFYFKGKSVPVPEIAQQLGVAYVIEGSVQRAGDKVKIGARLTKAADGFQVWSDSFTRDAKDVFAVEEEIAVLIAKQLSLKLGTAAAPARAVNPEAMELYLRGRQSWALRTRENIVKAEELFLRAIALQPDFAQAHAGLADAWLIMAELDGLDRFKNRTSHDWDRIVARLDEAAALDPNSADCFASRGEMAYYRWQFAEADQFFRRALELNPNYATAHQWYARYLSLQGRMDEALAQIDAALASDPFAPRIASNAAMIYVLAGRPTKGLELAERSLALQSGNAQGRVWKAEALVALGRSNELVQFVRTWAEGDAAKVNALGITYLAQVGRLDQPLGENPLRGLETGGYVSVTSYNVIRANLVFGRKADALAGLMPDEAAYAICEWMAYLPLFDQIRSEPAFRRIYEHVGLAEAYARTQAWRAAHPPEKPAAK